MKKIKSKSFLVLIIVLSFAKLSTAQESINCSGGNATGTGGSAVYSIGQVVYTTNTGSSGSVAQGVQHAYEIFIIGINETTLNISLSAFPNPTTDKLTLDISNYNNEKLSYQLYDIGGKVINKGQIEAKQTQINMVDLPAATYLIHVTNQENNKIQSFKIIKN